MGQLDVGREVMIADDNSASTGSQNAENAVRKLLTLQGYRITPKADVGVFVSFAERSPSLGFETQPEGENDNSPTQIKAEKHNKRINFCADRVYRLTVAFVDQRSSKVAYRGFSEQVSCEPPDDNSIYNLSASAMRSLRRTE